MLKMCVCISLLKKTKTTYFIVGEKTMKKRSVLNIRLIFLWTPSFSLHYYKFTSFQKHIGQFFYTLSNIPSRTELLFKHSGQHFSTSSNIPS
ncbi:hypothetical protein Pint_36229 [Pistacia integerrima]|uniref:Uncharacterized protein n=1 Tax=Pistacia integerrima TaxID=434235 RepID=A0ACC0Y1Y6_9ROSI|nr:hypothetical protein Pint_36229 [Pistacia integerrima]